MQLKTVVTLFAVLTGLASASNQAPSYGGNNGGNGGNAGKFTGGYGGQSDLSDDDIKVILEAHNEYRSGCGLPPVNYDKKVASVAQQWARRNPGGCSAMNHNNNRQGLGENIACQTGGKDKKKRIRDMIHRWGGEFKSCGNTAGCSFRGGSSSSGATGHFTQMVDATCQSIGCAENNGFLVCNYHPAGNMRGREKQNICPKGFKGLGNGAGGKIDGGNGGTSPAPSYGGNNNSPAPVNPAPTYGGNNNNSPAPVTPPTSYNPGQSYGPSRNNNNNNNGGNRGNNRGGNRYYTVTKTKKFNNGNNNNMGGFTPVYNKGNNNNNSGNQGNNRPQQSYGGNNNDSGSGGQPSYGGNNNNNGGQADKDCDETKKAKKL